MISIALFSFTVKNNECGITTVTKSQFEIAEKNCLTSNDISALSSLISNKYGMKISETQDYDLDFTDQKIAAGIKVVFKSRAVRRTVRARVLVVGIDDGGDDGDDGGDEELAKMKAVLAKYAVQ